MYYRIQKEWHHTMAANNVSTFVSVPFDAQNINWNLLILLNEKSKNNRNK